jgi:hypothetical protein
VNPGELFSVMVLKPVAQVFYNAVCLVSTDVAKFIFIGVIASIIIWISTLKNESVDQATGQKYPLHRDLRVWAVIILVLQAAGYYFLG